jgi:RNA polymerase sporulation-specific sigma factor
VSDLSDHALIELLHQSLDSPALPVLFERYRPVLQRLQNQYFIPEFEPGDWEQEALLVMCDTVRRFDADRLRSFGAYYRLRLAHRIFDLIRQAQALKRQMTRNAMSIETEAEYIADTVPDHHWLLREQLETKEAIYQVLPRLSGIEHTVFTGLLLGQTLASISQQYQLSDQQVRGACHRGQAKLRQVLAE